MCTCTLEICSGCHLPSSQNSQSEDHTCHFDSAAVVLAGSLLWCCPDFLSNRTLRTVKIKQVCGKSAAREVGNINSRSKQEEQIVTTTYCRYFVTSILLRVLLLLGIIKKQTSSYATYKRAIKAYYAGIYPMNKYPLFRWIR